MELPEIPHLLRTFLTWWRDELLSFIPASIRQRFKQNKALLIARLEDGALHFAQVQGNRTDDLGSIDLPDGPTEAQREAVQRAIRDLPGKAPALALDLPAGQVLSRTLSFPAAAEENLRQVALYEMTRRTPFTPDEVYHTVSITDRNPETQQIGVALHVVPRTAVDGALATMAALGLRPERVGAATAALSAANGVNFLPADAAKRSSRLWPIATGGLGLVTACLLAVALILPLEQKHALSAQLAEQVSALRKEAIAADRINAQIAEIQERNRFILEQQSQRRPAIKILDDLTKLLPDDTWIFQLRLQNDQVSAQGYANAVSALVERIESDPRFRNVAVQSRVTRDPKTGLERFHILFDLASGGA